MLASFSVSFALLKYAQKAFIGFWLLGLLSCKDFKSWESKYISVIKIEFTPEKDEWAPKVLKDLGSQKLSKLNFIKTPGTPADQPIKLMDDYGTNGFLLISLNPDLNKVSFELQDENNMYHQKVTICYERMLSLISPEAGGLQIQYTIREIQFDPDAKINKRLNKKVIFKKFTIDNPVPLKEEKEKHVTLYY